ncbi:hypothetical protein CJ030_MR4G009223 [Morella rubra]|uniref:Uncharacterized protein n=1 Tax=Morella rubra TaxID=262757 RepID=A0A6A1VSN3_9ROSI|nr:hypothetical protein CJ030_MR4G009223 [Morella rubra]
MTPKEMIQKPIYRARMGGIFVTPVLDLSVSLVTLKELNLTSNELYGHLPDTGAIVAIVIANCMALLVIVSFVVAHYCARDRGMLWFDGGKREWEEEEKWE